MDATNQPSGAYRVRPLIEVIGLPTPEQARRLVVLLKLAEPRKKEGAADVAA
ncbi:hypothetical protein ACFV1N_17695 [Streptosporangium canum]|uniref:hypothetical protein n=1 Tax=Streptosporangium canum TaxID=324952 RepID=UPI0036CDBAC7